MRDSECEMDLALKLNTAAIQDGKDEDSDSEAQELKEIDPLTQSNSAVCQVCKAKNPKILTIYSGVAFFLCETCIPKWKNSLLISYLSKNGIIPLQWYSGVSKETHLKFYRSSKNKVFKGFISIPCIIRTCVLADKKKKLSLRLAYGEDPATPSGELQRQVTLENIFKHTPEFYKKLTSEKYLMGVPFGEFSFKDLPANVQDMVQDAWKTASACKDGKFIY